MQKMPSMPSGKNRSGAAKLLKQDASVGAGTWAFVLVLISLIMFTFSAREPETGFFHTVQSVVQTVVSPVRYVGAGIVSPFTGLANVFRNLTADEQTLSELKQENERLSARNVELEEAELTAHRLQELLDLRDTYQLKSVAARVIAGSADSWTDTVSIDKGSAAGLAVGMPVANQNSAVGQIISCSANTSTVRLLSDEGSSVSAMVQSSRAQGMLQGSPDGSLHLALIRTDQTISMGDIVVTSGLGGVFPKGLPLGKVASVDSSPGAAYYEIEVEPFSRIANLEEVLVITSLTDSQQADAKDIESADAVDLEAASGHSANTKKSSDVSGDENSQDESSGQDEEKGQDAESGQDADANQDGDSTQERGQEGDNNVDGNIGNEFQDESGQNNGSDAQANQADGEMPSDGAV